MRRRMIVWILCIWFLLGTCALTAKAQVLGLTTQTPEEEKKKEILSSLGLEATDSDRAGGAICGFDAKEDGTYALAFRSGSNCTVQVYGPDGVFLYGLRFRADGDFSVGFHEDGLAIFLLRGAALVVCDANGACIDVQNVTSDPANLLHAKELLNRTSKQVGGRIYMLERDVDFWDTYSRFVLVYENGERMVLYDQSAGHAAGQGLALAFTAGFFLFVIWGIIRKRKQNAV